ncbi:hypothetical protein [Maricaulis sp. CAU 1757]
MRRDGFSVMEALVAIAVIAAAMIPLFELQRSLANSTARLQATAARLDVEASALAYLQAIDPIGQPEGELVISEWTLTWQSELIASEPFADGYLGAGLYDISLYQINAELTLGEVSRPISLRRVAWLQSRSPLDF